MTSRLLLLAWLGVRNLVLHRVKSAIVGLLLFFGTFLVVVSMALVGSVRASMERSITSSLAGQIQVYDANARDTLALFPGGSPGAMDIGEIPDFASLHDTLVAVPNVKDVVPMGMTNAIVLGSTEMDRALEQLRAVLEGGRTEEIPLLREQVLQIARGLRKDVENARLASADPAREDQKIRDLDRVESDAFWASLEQDPQGALSFLDGSIAPLSSDGRSLYLRLIGTDLDLFPKAFDRFRMVDGSPVPSGSQGLLLSKRFYETQVKNEVAKELDDIKKALDQGRTLANDPALRDQVKRNLKQYKRVLYQVPSQEAETVRQALLAATPGSEGDLATVLQAFLDMDDSNFQARYDLFYQVVAPRIRLYEVAVGEDVVLRGFTRSGYARAVNVTLYGTFTFDGLESSDLAGVNQLTDLETFRSLYGRMTDEQQAELADIRASAGVSDLSREDAEAALFGGAAPTGGTGAPSAELPTTVVGDGGLVLNAAVLLEDPRLTGRTLDGIRQAFKDKGMPIQAVDWKQAAGLVGQLLTVIQAVIYTGIFIIFLVALAIINNTMMMSAMERTQEIGTLRAIGARRGFVVGLFLVETLVLGLVAGGAGALAGAAFIGILGQVGIPALADILVLVFAGPRLHPVFTSTDLLFGLGIVVAFAVISALQPTLLAARVSPVVAMAQKD